MGCGAGRQRDEALTHLEPLERPLEAGEGGGAGRGGSRAAREAELHLGASSREPFSSPTSLSRVDLSVAFALEVSSQGLAKDRTARVYGGAPGASSPLRRLQSAGAGRGLDEPSGRQRALDVPKGKGF